VAETEADRVLLAQISGVAKHLAWGRPGTPEEHAAAVEELRRIAKGRADLLAELAGVAMGVGESQLDKDVYERIADLCMDAGADENQIEYWVAVGRHRAAHARIAPAPGALRRW
jgi:hypothetical protein